MVNLQISCLLLGTCLLIYGTTGSKLEVFTYNAPAIYKNPVPWTGGPVSFLVKHCVNVSIHINSTCCHEVILTNSVCGQCSGDGLTQCFVLGNLATYTFTDTANGSCLDSTTAYISCVTCVEGYCPTGHSTTTMGFKHTPLTDRSFLSLSTTNTNSENPMIPRTESSGTPAQANLTTRLTTESMSSAVVSLSPFITSQTINSNITSNETSTERPFDLEKSKRDMYIFLAALGASLLLVFIIVCAFFIRKSRSKVPIVNISDEFWSSKDYITDLDDGNFCPGLSYNVINPVCNTKSYTARNSYLKNEETVLPNYVKTESFRPSYQSYTPQAETGIQLESVTGNLSHKDKVYYSTDDEVGVVMDLTKIVSNEIKMQQRAKNMEDRKIISDKASINNPLPSTSSGGHYRKGKRQNESRQRMRSGQRTSRNSVSTDADHERINTSDIYAVSYKNRFHEYFDQCSAEESDV